MSIKTVSALVKLDLPGEPVLKVESFTLTIDENWSPYIQGSIQAAYPGDELMNLIDPRAGLIAQLTITEGSSSKPYFLHVEEVIARDSKTITLTVSSGEAKLLDQAWDGRAQPQSPVSWATGDTIATNWPWYGAISSRGSLNAIVANVLARHGWQLEPSPEFTLNYAPTWHNLIKSDEIDFLPDSNSSASIHEDYRNALRAFDLTGLNNGTVSTLTFYNNFQDFRPVTEIGKKYSLQADIFSQVNVATNSFISIQTSGSGFQDSAKKSLPKGEEYFPGAGEDLINSARLSMSYTAKIERSRIRVTASPRRQNQLVLIANLLLVEGERLPPAYFCAGQAPWLGWSANLPWADSYYTILEEDGTSSAYAWDHPLIQRIGQSDWDYLQVLCTAAGARLYCNRLGEWRLVALGEVSAEIEAELANITSFEEAISRDTGFASQVIIEYRWTDEERKQRTAFDVAGFPGKTRLELVQAEFQGTGEAQALLEILQTRGRQLVASAPLTLEPTPGRRVQILGGVAVAQRVTLQMAAGAAETEVLTREVTE